MDKDKDFGRFNEELPEDGDVLLDKEGTDVRTFENNEEGSKENRKESENQGEDNAAQKEADEAKGQNPFEKEKTDFGESKTDGSVKQEYSSCYKPPYYVPNFTVVDTNPADVENTKSTNKGSVWKISLVAIVVLVSIIVVGVLGIFSFAVNRLGDKDNTVDMGDEQLTVVQNSPKVDFVQNTDIDYVPQSLPEVVSKVGNSVVEIKTSSKVSDRFYGQYVTSGAGSGVIVTQSDEAGYLLTNHHVIHNEDNSTVDSITVVLTNGEEYEAQKIGTDYSVDLAVLRIEKKGDEVFTVAQFGDSSKLLVGQDVIAIGNPLGSLGGTVTDGIISALDRRVQVDDVTMVLLQHNAAINPGNSGGALFDMSGNLIGIVNAKTSDTGIEGLGFAIPINIALSFFNRVMVTEPAIGIRVAYGKPDKNAPVGVYVVEVTNKDFEELDQIIKVNGEDIETSADYYAIIDACKVGDTITITVRRGTKNHDISVVLKN